MLSICWKVGAIMTKWGLGVILCDLVLALVINTSAMLLSGAEILPAPWYTGVACAFFTNVVVQLIVPVPRIGQVLSRVLEGKAARPILAVFVENLLFVTCISITMALLNIASTGAPFLETWLHTYVYLVLIGYITSLILYAITARVSRDGH